MRPESSGFESEFCRRGNFSKKQFEFLVCSEFIHTQSDSTCTCVVACFHTCVTTDADTVERRERKERQHHVHHYTYRHTSRTDTHSTDTSHFYCNCGCVLDDSR